MVLKFAYDEDWLDEKAILSYYNDDEGEDEPGFEEAKKAGWDGQRTPYPTPFIENSGPTQTLAQRQSFWK